MLTSDGAHGVERRPVVLSMGRVNGSSLERLHNDIVLENLGYALVSSQFLPRYGRLWIKPAGAQVSG